MNKKTIRDVDLAGKRVLVRVDFNVPLDGTTITDDTRIRAAIPTLKYILEQHPKAVILTSHLGRPKGERNPEMSLKPVVAELSAQLGVNVAFADDCVGEIADNAIAALDDGGVILLENTRYHADETKNDPEFAAQLAKNGDIFVNDAFGTAHRAHASNVGVADHLEAVAGFLLEKEIDYLDKTIENPAKPFVAILGGAKVAGKIDVIQALLGKVDKLLIGGGMANTFFAAQGREMANSLVDEPSLGIAKDLMATGGDKIMLPLDNRIADDFSNDANMQVIPVSEDVPDGWEVLDIGPATLTAYQDVIANAKTVVWNGPMGVFELPNFAKGTFGLAEALAQATQENGVISIIGGGDSAAATEQSGLADQMTHISTGGGASLEMLEGKVLPGLAALADK
ncbi:MAG: phosphoglycerate kinase [Phototrophicaceae bacterium]